VHSRCGLAVALRSTDGPSAALSHPAGASAMTISQDSASPSVDRNATEAKRARSNRPPKRAGSMIERALFGALPVPPPSGSGNW
jgi:hypothetical protein